MRLVVVGRVYVFDKIPIGANRILALRLLVRRLITAPLRLVSLGFIALGLVALLPRLVALLSRRHVITNAAAVASASAFCIAPHGTRDRVVGLVGVSDRLADVCHLNLRKHGARINGVCPHHHLRTLCANTRHEFI